MLAKDIGIDLGTANVLIYIKGEGIVLDEPSIVAIDTDTKRVIAAGKEANEMFGRTPNNIKTIRPIKYIYKKDKSKKSFRKTKNTNMLSIKYYTC